MDYKTIRKMDTKNKLGKRIIRALISEEKQKQLNVRLKDRSRTRLIKEYCNKEEESLKALIQTCLEHIQPVTAPLAMISQIQRSGGSLLSQLFDGHPEVHAHPHELKVGYPKKYNWPEIDLNDNPEQWFEILFEDIVVEHLRHGYKKMAKYKETFLFAFLPPLQRKIFLKYLNSVESKTRRCVFDAYMTSYFGAWINNQNLPGQKKIVTAFTPRLAMKDNNMKSFFDIYPDGRLISIVRDPQNWFPSATRHKLKKYGDIRHALDQWLDSAKSMVQNKKRYGDRVCIISFEDLIRRTESVMQYLAEFLNIRFDAILLTPTFNRIPIKPNTSFKLEKSGIMISALERYKTLSREELEIINEMTREVYNQVLDVVVSIDN
jgi:hypothetical protein